MTAHPRAGGENPWAFSFRPITIGSSPRGRGKHGVQVARSFCERLIPARAGKTVTGRASSARHGAHPRAGGENRYVRVAAIACMGSSPRGRGKQRRLFRAPLPRRLIPARAGKTDAANDEGVCWPAHPRAGGENVKVRVLTPYEGGSSPRGRGKQKADAEALKQFRLIPARAGKTRSTPTDPWSCQAHPRAGGENYERKTGQPITAGSSPRGRGKPDEGTLCVVSVRLIPARAGKTKRATRRAQPLRAHPRAGGENLAEQGWDVPALGSSPRGRGKPPRRLDRRHEGGLIPARAGKTLSRPTTATSSRAHPRAGGENLIGVAADLSAQGSSPRGRGKRTRPHQRRRSRGLIPARAGKTPSCTS